MKHLIETILYFPLYLYFFLRNRFLLNKEIDRWYEVLPIQKSTSILYNAIWLLSNLKEFRSILYFRYKVNKYNPLLIFFPPQYGLYIASDQKIGKGLVFQHGFSTIINCEKMGDNCQIWQGVTIGKSHSGINQPRPIIGNNVKICTNAIVLGGITIGDNVTIGAGAVVIKSVPDNCTVVGNPAKPISHN